jgi:predicted ArsR family transcriptional regulator
VNDREGRRLRALAVPTRRRLLDLVGQAPAGSTVSELTAATGLHPNTVRLHLEVLARAGLVEGMAASAGAPASTGRGRPPARYVAVAEADEAAAISGP